MQLNVKELQELINSHTRGLRQEYDALKTRYDANVELLRTLDGNYAERGKALEECRRDLYTVIERNQELAKELEKQKDTRLDSNIVIEFYDGNEYEWTVRGLVYREFNRDKVKSISIRHPDDTSTGQQETAK